MKYATDPTTLRSEAGDIEIGAPDGNGYAGWLRACADRIEYLESRVPDEDKGAISTLTHALRQINAKAHDGAVAGGIDETVALENIADISDDALQSIGSNSS